MPISAGVDCASRPWAIPMHVPIKTGAAYAKSMKTHQKARMLLTTLFTYVSVSSSKYVAEICAMIKVSWGSAKWLGSTK